MINGFLAIYGMAHMTFGIFFFDRIKAEEISERTEYLELSGRPNFQAEFMSAMMFPGK